MLAHEHGQEARLANKWTQARKLFLECAQPICPAPLVKDCTQWSGELAQQIPSIVVAAKRPDGRDAEDVALFVDAAPIGPRLPSTPILLDPGPHTLRFEHAGWSPVEERVVLRDGEQERGIRVQFTAPGRTTVPAERSPPVAAYVATGFAAVLAAVSIAFLVRGKTSEHDLATSPCGRAGTCTDAQVSPIRTDYIVSGVTAGAAGIALGLAIWQFAAHGSTSNAASGSPLHLTF
jgi:hypothetical protein